MKWLAILFLAVGTTISKAADIHVFAAASLTDALQEIAATWEKESGHKLRFNLGASSLLARQIQEGAPADLFFSADEEKMDGLEKKGLLRDGTRKRLLSNSLVIVIANDSRLDLKRPEDLARARRIALAETRTVPAGIYARRYLEQKGLWPQLSPLIVPTENVRATLSAVEGGNVDAAIVYKTDAAIAKRTKVAYEIPISETPGISYPVALLKDGKQPKPAQDFLTHLQSPPALRVFEEHGFLVLRD